ncbi:hypothetical protein [Alkalimarinus alittae]|uniref:Uncharacterized protein n=1 Tax=Alkalimarinus alittae TaxID=2961619 RepID=A0ABY6MZ24_9ALTE|nr:hypothetical protein [Alkalimarinus alittae]UZE95014.1 hypothetical protein NKI27_13170 [Alkalimarinus alittae]
MPSQNPAPAFDSLSDHELMLLQEMCGRNFDYSDRSQELLDAFIRMDQALLARGFTPTTPITETKTTRTHKAA